jgi:transcriptional regulator with XRE-family HTH domain
MALSPTTCDRLDTKGAQRMGAREFGRMVEEARKAKGWSYADLAAGIGILPDGRGLDPSRVRRITLGTRELKPGDPTTIELVTRLIKFLALPWEEAWKTVGLWPPDLDEGGYRRFRAAVDTGEFAAVGVSTDLHDHTKVGLWDHAGSELVGVAA